MDTSTYQSVVDDLNGSIQLAGLTGTLTFVLLNNQTIDSVPYSNVISFSGYYLSVNHLKINQIILNTLLKYGEWSSLKRTFDVNQVPPSSPGNDHYDVSYGYYVHNSDVNETILVENKINSDLQSAVAQVKSTVSNIGTRSGYDVTSMTGSATISAIDMSNNRTVNITVTATYHEPV